MNSFVHITEATKSKNTLESCTLQRTPRLKEFQDQIFPTKTLYGCKTDIAFTLKMELVMKITIFGVTKVVKRGLEKLILKSLIAGRW